LSTEIIPQKVDFYYLSIHFIDGKNITNQNFNVENSYFKVKAVIFWWWVEDIRYKYSIVGVNWIKISFVFSFKKNTAKIQKRWLNFNFFGGFLYYSSWGAQYEKTKIHLM